MKLRFYYSERYFKELNRFTSPQIGWEKIRELGTKFEEKYKDILETLPDIIEKIVGRKWRDETLEIYLVSHKGPSFSHPLTLKVREDLLLVFVVLIHEIIHRVKVFSQNKIENEKITNDYTEKVLKELRIKAKEQINKLRSFSEVEG